MHRPPAQARRTLSDHRRNYDRLVEIVRRRAERADTEGVLRSAALAATYAWLAPTGLLCDPALERLVVDAVGHGEPPVIDGDRGTGRVLHVLSEGYKVGGHTRLARRWISRDHRASDVALTAQRDPVPRALTDAVVNSGGRLHDLRSSSADLLGRAVALRGLIDQVDLVVLHVHPNDVVALAAVALPGTRPPVVFENHADHAFWLGVGAADVLCEFRDTTRLSARLRGVDPDRISVLPLPIDPPESGWNTAELRHRLGIAPDAVVGVSVASAAKLAPTWGRGMAALLDRALTCSPRLTVVLVGVPPTGEWATLAARHHGRLVAVGTVPDPDPWYELADIYLESYPTRAGTSPLEAALAGLPILAMQDIPPTELHHNFQADSPGMTGWPRAQTPEQYVSALRRLVDQPERRVADGAAAQAAVLAAHCGQPWAAALERVYDQARTAAPVDLARHPGPIVDQRYGEMLATFLAPQLPMSCIPVEPATRAIGELFDDALEMDLLAVLSREAGHPLTVRAAAGWEAHPGWTARLLTLAAQHRHLAVSLPFAARDDRSGTQTTALLTELLHELGQTTETCGTISLDTRPPAGVCTALGTALSCTSATLDRLELLLTSPLWTPATDPARTAA